MSEDRQLSSTEHTVFNHDIEENTRANSEQNFLSVLTAMQASMSQTNEYSKCIFEGVIPSRNGLVLATPDM